MSQFREHNFQKASPASFPGASLDPSNVIGTPTSRIMAFSPGANSTKSATILMQTPDHDGSDSQHSVFSPTAHSSGGFRKPCMSGDKDPFVTPSSKGNDQANQPLSATASAFHPFYNQMSSESSGEGRMKAANEPENNRSNLPDMVSPVLSTGLDLSRCVELSTPSQAITSHDVEAYLAKLASLGSPCQGNKQIYIKNAKGYIRFTNIRDACVTHRNVQLCGPDWTAVFMSPSEFSQTIVPGENMASPHEGQLDMLAVLLHNAPMELSQLEPSVFRILQAEGDLFAFQKDSRSEEGALKAILEYSDINVAIGVAMKLNGLMVDGLHLRLDFFRPDGHTGRAAPVNGGVATPMPTPGRFQPDDFMAHNGHKLHQPVSGPLVPARHQPTPPSGGMSGPPQVALVPMVLRNAYSPGTPIILDPYGPQGHRMGPLTNGSSLVYPPGAPLPPIMGPHGYDSLQRGMSLANRYANRRGGTLRNDRSLHFNPNGHHNQVDTGRIRDGVDVRTTIMLRNIPNKVDQRMLKAIIDESSWGKYDFMYLRIDFANDCNVGYAFINFADPLDIIDFANARDNQRWNCFRSDKVAEISYATIQGRDCLVQKFRNSSVMLEAPHYRPKLYYTLSGPNPELAGREEEFPGPDNPSKMKRSCENAEHVGLFTPHLSQYYRDEQRRRRSQYDRGTRMAALEEFDYDTTFQQRMYPSQ